MRYLLTSVFMMVLLACGDEESQPDEETVVPASPATESVFGGMTFTAEADVPACDDSREGQLIYVQSANNFRTCGKGNWTVVDLKGEKGDAGEKGEKGEAGDKGVDGLDYYNSGFVLYQKYRRSIFRIVVTCSDGSAGCSGLTGSGFYCQDNRVCTNNHVLTCPAGGSTGCAGGNALTDIKITAVNAQSDSVHPGAGAGNMEDTPFYQANNTADITASGSFDLAKITVTTIPSDAEKLSIPNETYDNTVSTLSPVLSMSFPLGFQDMYTDLGFVNQGDLEDCQNHGAVYGNCAIETYDFSTSNDTDHGSSGSPLIDVRTGSLIGVVSAGTDFKTATANYSWIIDAQKLTTFDPP